MTDRSAWDPAPKAKQAPAHETDAAHRRRCLDGTSLRILLRHHEEHGGLSPAEEEAFEGMAETVGRGRSLSEKQWAWLMGTGERLGLVLYDPAERNAAVPAGEPRSDGGRAPTSPAEAARPEVDVNHDERDRTRLMTLRWEADPKMRTVGEGNVTHAVWLVYATFESNRGETLAHLRICGPDAEQVLARFRDAEQWEPV